MMYHVVYRSYEASTFVEWILSFIFFYHVVIFNILNKFFNNFNIKSLIYESLKPSFYHIVPKQLQFVLVGSGRNEYETKLEGNQEWEEEYVIGSQLNASRT